MSLKSLIKSLDNIIWLSPKSTSLSADTGDVTASSTPSYQQMLQAQGQFQPTVQQQNAIYHQQANSIQLGGMSTSQFQGPYWQGGLYQPMYGQLGGSNIGTMGSYQYLKEKQEREKENEKIINSFSTPTKNILEVVKQYITENNHYPYEHFSLPNNANLRTIGEAIEKNLQIVKFNSKLNAIIEDDESNMSANPKENE